MNIKNSLLISLLCLLFSMVFLNIFNISAQEQFYKYPGNPVFIGNPGEWDNTVLPKSVIYEDNLYKMWYGAWASASPEWGYGLATSPDGINWTRVQEEQIDFNYEDDSTTWEDVVYHIEVEKVGSLYYLWYVGRDNDRTLTGTGFAQSTDGIHWHKHPDRLRCTDGTYLPNVSSVVYDGEQFHLWYSDQSEGVIKFVRLNYASSTDGITWKKYSGNPVLTTGEPGAWDDQAVTQCDVIYNGSFFEMFYHGWNLVQAQVGYAKSADGKAWTKSPYNPVIKASEDGYFDSWLTSYPVAEYHDGVYRVWYYGVTDQGGAAGYATSSAGEALAWEKDSVIRVSRQIRLLAFNQRQYFNIDSLVEILPKLNQQGKVDVYNDLALANSLNNSGRGMAYADSALDILEDIHYPKGEAMALFAKGNCQYVLDNFTEALSNQLMALRIFDSLSLYAEQAAVLTQIASIHSFAGNHEFAAQYYQEALDIYSELKDTSNIIQSLEYLGREYRLNGNIDSATETFKAKLHIAELGEREMLWRLGAAYLEIAECYAGRNLDSAVHYLKRLNILADSLGNIPKGMHIRYGEVYSATGPDYYELALEHYHKSWPRMGERPRLYYGIAALYYKMGDLENSRKNLDAALHYCISHLTKLDSRLYLFMNQKLENEFILKPFMEKIYRLYYKLDSAEQNHASALENYKLASLWQDSIYDKQNRRQWAMIQGQFNTELAQEKIIILEQDNALKNMTIKQTRIYMFILGVFLVITLLMAVLLIRQNRIKAEHQMVVLEQKLLRLQMNPHFIFNALSSILGFIQRKDNVNAAGYLTSFSSLLRTTLESSREDYILLADEVKSLTNYLNLQLLRYQNKFTYAIEIDDKIDLENAIIPPMLIQPIIENAIEHGIRHKKGQGQISVRFRLESKKVICEVEDNGVGREKAWEAGYQRRKTHKSLATDIIYDRINALNKKLKQKIMLNIIDLKSDMNVAAGTKVVLNLPYLLD
jgi:hypothetical protein